MPIRRRRFLAGAAALAATGCATRRGGWRFFTLTEARTLDALCEQLIPADAGSPGARDAQAVRYIDRQLTRHFREHQETYRRGLAKLNELAGGDFAGLDFAKQTPLVARIEKEDKPFFDLALAHTQQGFYGNPRHGGNREYVSWRMLGVPVSPARGRELYDFTKGGRPA